MRWRFRPAILTLLLLLPATAATFAHHSVAGQFDTSKALTLTGVISKVEWINPHIYLQLDVRDEGGAVTSWALATLPTAMMRRAGLTREAVQGRPGEVVTVAANPARDESRRLAWVNRITYADGHTIQLTGQ
jgi:hypothetical protein